VRQNLNDWFCPVTVIWSTELGTDIVQAGDILIVKKSFHGIVCAIRNARESLDKGGSVDRRRNLWHVEDSLTGHDFYLDGVSAARKSFEIHGLLVR
jgi:hypothetical protein